MAFKIVKKHPTKKAKKPSRPQVSPPPVAGILKALPPRIQSSMLDNSISDKESKPMVAFSSPGTHHLMKRRRRAPAADSKKASAVEVEDSGRRSQKP
jgi:hypothetical protein